MKFFVILSLISFTVMAQTGEISYSVKPLKKEYSAKSKEFFEDINKEMELMTFTLTYNTELSYFKQNRSIPLDAYNYKMASNIVNYHFPWYQYAKQKESIFVGNVKKDFYQVVHDKLKIENWELTEETKTIDGYVCYKAKTSTFSNRTRSYHTKTAWYCPDISVPYGPVGEGGLPGLILQLNINNNFVFTVNEIKLNPKKIKIPKIKDAERITSKELTIKLRKVRKYTVD